MSEVRVYSYIRWSTSKQTDKDSERRQIEAAERYIKRAEENADDESFKLIPLRDPATSGYSGKHISKGELGQFLTQVKRGEIPEGSRLIFESVDRLTRLKINEAQKLFIELLEAGITLVPLDHGSNPEITLNDYQKNQGIVYQLTGEIQRANRESERKSVLISKARENEREKAREGKKLISGMPPMWLEFNEDQTGFVIKEEVVEAIRLMFKMKENGKGAYRIERELNQMKDIYHPPKSKRNKSGAWRKSTINRYLKDRRLLGEYQPYEYINKDDGTRKRVKSGPIIPDYYDPVIDKKLFNRVQQVLESNSKRNGNAGGQTGKVSNLFVHLVKCEACGDSMRFINKGDGRPKLRCDDNIRGLSCEEDRKVRYDTIVEPILLRYCRGLDVSDIIPGDEKRQSELASAQKELQEIEGALSGKQEVYERVYKDYTEEEHDHLRENLRVDLRKKLDEIESLEEKKSELESKISELTNSTKTASKRLKDIQELIERLENATGKEKINLRLSVRSKLQSLINRIEVGFGSLDEYGQPYITFVIKFKDGVKQTISVIDGRPDETFIKDGDNFKRIDLAKERQREANRKIKINQKP